MTFEEWAETWDTIFDLCKQGKIQFIQLLTHTLKYDKKWNRGDT